MIKPFIVLFGTLIVYLILQKFDKKIENEENLSKTKIILTKISLFVAIFIIFIGLIYWVDILSLINFKNIIGGKNNKAINDMQDMKDVSVDMLKQNYAEVETIKKIRENIHVGLIPDNMSIGEISRK